MAAVLHQMYLMHLILLIDLHRLLQLDLLCLYHSQKKLNTLDNSSKIESKGDYYVT